MPLEYVPLWTFSDAVEHLIDSANATSVPEERRKARRAVLDAYREFPQKDKWAYYSRPGLVTMQASQSDGTLSFDFTGGAEERLVTLSGATVPANGSWFTLVLDGVHYPIETVVSSTTFTLPEFANPGADVAAATEYSMYRSIYPVPVDFRVGDDPVQFDGMFTAPVYVSPADIVQLMRHNSTPMNWSQAYTIRGGGQQYSGLVFEFAPPPSAAATLQFNYWADPRPIGLIGTEVEYSTGTVSVSGTTVTGVTTAWTSRMIGSVIRFTASTTALPTGAAGAYGNDNPYTEQRVITDVASATSLTIDQALTGTYPAVKYTIGDPLDLDYHVMLEAFQALCEWKFASGIRCPQEIVDAKEAAWRRSFGRARAQDFRKPESSQTPVPVPWHAGARST
jgi:hypothetical protein